MCRKEGRDCVYVHRFTLLMQNVCCGWAIDEKVEALTAPGSEFNPVGGTLNPKPYKIPRP